MIRHTVVFKLRDTNNTQEVQQFFIAARELAHITGVRRFECLQQVGSKNNFDFGISMEFDDQQLYDEYSNHPDHVQFIQNYWIKYVEHFLEIDYAPLD